MLPATIMNAAWAPQPDPLTDAVREVSRHLAQIAGWVPHFLDELVRGMCQRFLPLVVVFPLSLNPTPVTGAVSTNAG
jgi:hypothetical protein